MKTAGKLDAAGRSFWTQIISRPSGITKLGDQPYYGSINVFRCTA